MLSLVLSFLLVFQVISGEIQQKIIQQPSWCGPCPKVPPRRCPPGGTQAVSPENQQNLNCESTTATDHCPATITKTPEVPRQNKGPCEKLIAALRKQNQCVTSCCTKLPPSP